MTARQPRDTTPTCHDCGWTGTTSTPALAAYAKARHKCATHRRRTERTQRRLDRLTTPGPTRDCHHPYAHHRHGTNPAYVLDRCRCLDCRAAHRRQYQARNRAKAYGRYTKWTDADPVRAHIANLAEHGIGAKRVAALSGVSQGAMTKLVYGLPGKHPSRRVLTTTADAILAVQPGPDTLAAGARVPSVGSTRRLQALVALGWSQARLATRLGILPSNFGPLVHGHRDTVASTARAVARLYDELSMRLPPQTTRAQKASVSRARNYARWRGWLPPLALDDDRLDDPDYQPSAAAVARAARADSVRGDRIDHAAVQRRMSGDRDVRLTWYEGAEVCRRLRADGWADKRIERHTGLNVLRYLPRRRDEETAS